MKRKDADLINQSSYSCAETRNAVSHTQAAESLHEISVNTPTLRDQFAMSALQGLCSNPGGPFQANSLSGWAIVNCELSDIAAESYRLADAMLEARK